MSKNDSRYLNSGPTSTGDMVGKLNRNSGSSRQTGYAIYAGEVLEADLVTKTLTVLVNNTTISNCLYVAGTFASILGVSSTALPQPGTRVVCLHTPLRTFVIGTLPSEVNDTEAYSGSITGDESYCAADDFSVKKNTNNAIVNSGWLPSRDLLPGEEELSNNIGSVIRILSNIAQLESGGMALVETCLLNDMVRICDNYFVHHNCGGDTLIWNNGRNNYESHFTSYPHEAAGKLDESDSIVENDGDDGLKEQDDPIDATGRWRVSTYKGFLGDMIHFWVTNPTLVISNYAESAARAGKFKTWVGADGTLMVLSAGDIVVEVTLNMVIPIVNHKWDNPELDLSEMTKELNSEYLSIWGNGDKRWDDLNASVWLMRQYLKYITLWHSLERWKLFEEKGFCSIPDELSSNAGSLDCDEKDKKQAGITSPEEDTDAKNRPRHAILRMSPDGSVLVIANGNTSVTLNLGNILLSAPNNIEIKAGGVFSVTARDVSIKAYKLVELISLTGTLVTKARTAWKALCERGKMWLKSDCPVAGVSDEDAADDTEFNAYSIVIDSSCGKTLVHGDQGAVVGTTGGAAPVILLTTGGGDINLYSDKNINLMAKVGYYAKSNTFGFSGAAAKFNVMVFNAASNFVATPNRVDVSSLIIAKQGLFNYVCSKDGYVGKDRHVGVYKERPDYKPEIKYDDCDAAGNKARTLSKPELFNDYAKLEFGNGSVMWHLYPWEVVTDMSNPNSIKADAWYDYNIKGIDFREDSENTIPVNWSECKLLPSVRTSSKEMPWPGQDALINVYDGGYIGCTIGEAWPASFQKDDIGSADDMKPQDLVYFFQER